jgi:hypothetical protein
MTDWDEWYACSYCDVTVDRRTVEERCGFMNSDNHLCGKPAHAGCAEAAAEETGLLIETVLCRKHLLGGQRTRPR